MELLKETDKIVLEDRMTSVMSNLDNSKNNSEKELNELNSISYCKHNLCEQCKKEMEKNDIRRKELEMKINEYDYLLKISSGNV